MYRNTTGLEEDELACWPRREPGMGFDWFAEPRTDRTAWVSHSSSSTAAHRNIAAHKICARGGGNHGDKELSDKELYDYSLAHQLFRGLGGRQAADVVRGRLRGDGVPQTV